MSAPQIVVDAVLDAHTQSDIVAKLNAALDQGLALVINGEHVASAYGPRRVRSYGTGSIGFETPTKTRGTLGRTRHVYVKPGRAVLATAPQSSLS